MIDCVSSDIFFILGIYKYHGLLIEDDIGLLGFAKFKSSPIKYFPRQRHLHPRPLEKQEQPRPQTQLHQPFDWSGEIFLFMHLVRLSRMEFIGNLIGPLIFDI